MASPTTAPLPWRPSLLYSATAACHVGALLAVLAAPSSWPWALGALGLNHALLTAQGLWPRSRWLGDNLVRLPDAAAARGEVCITIDDGPDPLVTPAVLDQLDAHGAKATFFCIAARAQAHPDLCRDIVRRGHSIQNHSHRHSHTFSLLGPRGFAQELGRAQQALQALSGETPHYFRAPAGLRNPLLAPVLRRLGLRLVSWTRRGFDTVQHDPARVLAKLVDGLRAGDILLLHDGNAARTAQGRPVVLEVLPALLQRLADDGLRPVTLPQALGSPAAACGGTSHGGRR